MFGKNVSCDDQVCCLGGIGAALIGVWLQDEVLLLRLQTLSGPEILVDEPLVVRGAHDIGDIARVEIALLNQVVDLLSFIEFLDLGPVFHMGLGVGQLRNEVGGRRYRFIDAGPQQDHGGRCIEESQQGILSSALLPHETDQEKDGRKGAQPQQDKADMVESPDHQVPLVPEEEEQQDGEHATDQKSRPCFFPDDFVPPVLADEQMHQVPVHHRSDHRMIEAHEHEEYDGESGILDEQVGEGDQGDRHSGSPGSTNSLVPDDQPIIKQDI